MSSSSVTVDSERKEREDFRFARGSLSGIKGRPFMKTSSPDSMSTIGMVVSADADLENRGAGGKGLRGLPPYCVDGVPGLGLPLRSARSY